MPPRFVNPHFLPDTTVSVSRQQIYNKSNDDTEDGVPLPPIDPGLVEELHRLIRASLDSEIQPEVHREKRRRVDVTPDALAPKSPVLFRLISNSQTLYPILLEPKPPPPPITREPDCEDNVVQAKTRRKRARAAAVDASWILSESKKHLTPSPRNCRKCSIEGTALPNPVPVMMILQSDQPFRKTRPPVSASQLLQRPYVEDGPFPSIGAVTNVPDCAVINVNFPKLAISQNETKRRRKRVNKLKLARPPPSFWRPNPAHGGKGLGYAMGYSCR